MNREELLEHITKLNNHITEMLASKGPEYQSGENVFSNFENNARDLGLSRYQIWSIYFNKHVKSILNAIKDNPLEPEESNTLSESLNGRIIDAVAYLTLLYGMVNQQYDVLKWVSNTTAYYVSKDNQLSFSF